MPQITGLASGMDIQGLVADLMALEAQSVTRLENQSTMAALKKTIYKDVSSQMEDFQKMLLDLKLESTFQTKTANSSSEALSATPSVDALNGSYSVRIDQVAEAAIAHNNISKVKVLSESNSSGITSVSGEAQYNINGLYTTSFTDKGGYVEGKYELTLDKKSYIQKTKGGSFEGSVEHTIGTDINSSNNRLNISYGDQTFDIYLDFYKSDQSSMGSVAEEIAEQINSKLNELNSTNNQTYVMVNVDDYNGAGNGSLSFYNVKEDSNSAITINDDGGGNLANSALGLNTTTQSEVDKITKVITSSDFSNLRVEINGNNFFDGYSLNTMGTITEGSFEAAISNTINPSPITKSRIDGGSDVATTTVDLYTTGLNNSGLRETITGVTDEDGKINSTFTINGVEITLNDIESLTMNDAMAIINGSGAGVTASYDQVNDRFVLRSNGENSSISLGETTDNSNFLEATKIAINSGGELYASTSSSNIDPSQTLSTSSLGGQLISGTATINGVSIYISNSDSLNDIIDKINNSSANISAAYDSNSDQFILHSKTGEIDTNERKIEIGSNYDTSNFFEIMNISGGINSSISADTSSLSGDFAGDTITFTGGGVSTDITLTSTSGTGAYTDVLDLDFTTGIEAGTDYMIAAGSDGSTIYHWTNNSGKTIYNMEDLLKEWNNSDNWTDNLGNPADTQVKMVAAGDNQIRLFNGSGGAAASFTIFNNVGSDISQIGVGSGTLQNQNMSDTASAIYNSFSIAYDIGWQFDFGGGLDITVDGTGGINFESGTKGIAGMFQFSDTTGTTASEIFTNGLRSSNLEEVGVAGKDSLFSVDGIDYRRSGNKVDDVIGGVNLQINNVSTSTITLDVEIDSDNVIEKIADFIIGYNDMIERLNPDRPSGSERKYLTPLSDEDKNLMSYIESDEYEAKFKLYNEYELILKDGALRDFSFFLRQEVTSIKDGLAPQFSSLSSIGIQIGSTGLQDDKTMGYLLFSQGDLSDDEYRAEIVESLTKNSKLMDNIDNNPDKLFTLFANNSETNSEYEDGIARVLDDKIDQYIKRGGIINEMTRVNGTIDQQLVNLYEQIEFYTRRNEEKEESLYEQFARMETTLSKLQADSTNFLSQMGLA